MIGTPLFKEALAVKLGGEGMNGEKMSTRFDSVRFVVLDMVTTIPCETRKQEACAHLFGVSAFAAMLAVKRRLSQELAASAGLLHNYYFYKTGISDFLELTVPKL